jgi:hypothetical protein
MNEQEISLQIALKKSPRAKKIYNWMKKYLGNLTFENILLKVYQKRYYYPDIVNIFVVVGSFVETIDVYDFGRLLEMLIDTDKPIVYDYWASKIQFDSVADRIELLKLFNKENRKKGLRIMMKKNWCDFEANTHLILNLFDKEEQTMIEGILKNSPKVMTMIGG